MSRSKKTIASLPVSREHSTICIHSRKILLRWRGGKPAEDISLEPCPACDAHRDHQLKRKEGGLFDERRVTGSEYD